MADARHAGLVDLRLAKALSHPLRARIFAILNEQVASPNEIADMLDERLPNVSYHVRALVELECVELVRTAQRRGAIEHYYRALRRPFFTDRDWKRLPRSGRQAISDVALKVVWEDVSAAIKAGTFDGRSDRHLSHNDITLDEEGWREVRNALAGMLDEVERIESASAARLKDSGDEGISATVVAMQFESPSPHAQES
jgi:DNA-binding transcriptional ArsR family regulator